MQICAIGRFPRHSLWGVYLWQVSPNHSVRHEHPPLFAMVTEASCTQVCQHGWPGWAPVAAAAQL